MPIDTARHQTIQTLTISILAYWAHRFYFGLVLKTYSLDFRFFFFANSLKPKCPLNYVQWACTLWICDCPNIISCLLRLRSVGGQVWTCDFWICIGLTVRRIQSLDEDRWDKEPASVLHTFQCVYIYHFMWSKVNHLPFLPDILNKWSTLFQTKADEDSWVEPIQNKGFAK